MTKPVTMRLTVLDTLRRGPVVIVVDGSNLKHVGLPSQVRNQALLVPVADFTDRVDLRQEDVFRLRYLEDGAVREATIHWTGVFAMTGTNTFGALGGIVGGPQLPRWFGEPQEQKAQEFLEQLCSPELWSKRKIAPVPICGLRTPAEPQKREAIQRCQRLGKSLVIADLRKMRPEHVPPALLNRTITVLAIAWPGLDTATQISRGSVAVTVRDHGIEPTRIELPWHAILAVVSDFGWPRAYTWPDDYPEELLTWTMRARAKVQEKQPPAHEFFVMIDPPDGTALGCDVNTQNEWGVAVSVSVGTPDEAGNRARFSVILPPDLPTLQ